MKLMAQRNLFGNLVILTLLGDNSSHDRLIQEIIKLDKNFANPTFCTIDKYHCIEYGAHSYNTLDIMASYHFQWNNAFFKKVTNTNIVVLVAPRPCLIDGNKK